MRRHFLYQTDEGKARLDLLLTQKKLEDVEEVCRAAGERGGRTRGKWRQKR